MANSAQYASTPVANGIRISTANAARDGTGTAPVVFAAGSSGARIDEVTVNAIGTTTAGMVRLYKQNAGSTLTQLVREVPVSAITPSATLSPFAQKVFGLSLILAAGEKLLASTNNAESFDVFVNLGGSF